MYQATVQYIIFGYYRIYKITELWKYFEKENAKKNPNIFHAIFLVQYIYARYIFWRSDEIPL